MAERPDRLRFILDPGPLRARILRHLGSVNGLIVAQLTDPAGNSSTTRAEVPITTEPRILVAGRILRMIRGIAAPLRLACPNSEPGNCAALAGLVARIPRPRSGASCSRAGPT